MSEIEEEVKKSEKLDQEEFESSDEVVCRESYVSVKQMQLADMYETFTEENDGMATAENEEIHAENNHDETMENKTLTMLKRRGVAIKFVKDETGDKTGDSENIDCEAATLANSDEKKSQIKECETTKTLSAIEKNVTVTENNVSDKKLAQFEKVCAGEEEFVSVTSTSGKSMLVKKKDLQNIMSSKTLPKMPVSQANVFFQCVKCSDKFQSKSALTNHSKVFHGLFTHFVTIK